MHQPSPTVFGRIARRVTIPTGDTGPWGPPPIPDLIAAIDEALKRRNRG